MKDFSIRLSIAIFTLVSVVQAGATSKSELKIFERGSCDSDDISCAEASIEKYGSVASDCNRVKNQDQEQCAGRSILKSGYVISDCLKLEAGGRCAVSSIEKHGYVMSDCFKIQNDRQDRCAKASIFKNGYVLGDCLKL